ncbi:MAG: hypothetical protein IJ877_05555 [Candidatus Gastranaerophilales bacterium]|nr:hypothetical protein [Candidatus Gastranaerophilales bacterium]
MDATGATREQIDKFAARRLGYTPPKKTSLKPRIQNQPSQAKPAVSDVKEKPKTIERPDVSDETYNNIKNYLLSSKANKKKVTLQEASVIGDVKENIAYKVIKSDPVMRQIWIEFKSLEPADSDNVVKRLDNRISSFINNALENDKVVFLTDASDSLKTNPDVISERINANKKLQDSLTELHLAHLEEYIKHAILTAYSSNSHLLYSDIASQLNVSSYCVINAVKNSPELSSLYNSQR